jgi:hypothetical protein
MPSLVVIFVVISIQFTFAKSSMPRAALRPTRRQAASRAKDGRRQQIQPVFLRCNVTDDQQ